MTVQSELARPAPEIPRSSRVAYAVGVAQFFAWYAARASSELQYRGEVGNPGYDAEPLADDGRSARDALRGSTAPAFAPAPQRTSARVTDHGRLSTSSDAYDAVEPADLHALRAAVAWANEHRVPVRIRGNGHSMNGASVPRANELYVSTKACRHYRFEEEETITVGSGAAIWDVRATVEAHGFELLVYNDGNAAASTVGGFLSAGGFGVGSARHGGFWETVKEVTMVTGDGRIRRFSRCHEEFQWLFGSMGQLGIAFEVKLRIRSNPRLPPRPYPMGKEGVVAESPTDDTRINWYTLFVPEADWIDAGKRIIAIGAKHRRAWRPRWPYVYSIVFRRFNPPLIHPAQESLKAVGIWGKPHAKGFDLEAMRAIEQEVTELALSNPRYRRYIQAELLPKDFDYRRYFGDAIYQRFMDVKKSLDPKGLMVPGVL
ncbi:FAD-binding oxidoreductase [Pendulispora albinea]|uniref:FAD-binding oxidoreductase n=1 Tax=Pendulispora albinea TaxID=2741071 RepID=A0ABZ2M396_9BACT